MQTIKIFLFLYNFLFCFISCDGQRSKNITCSVENAIKTINSLPEVQKQSKFVDSLSKSRQHLSFMTDTIKYNNKQYYRIKTGFSSQFHWETYTIFYVDKNNCKSVMVDETISGDIITLKKWRNLNRQVRSNNPTDNIEFSDLFNEGSQISFTPDSLNSNNPEIVVFKNSLNSFEKTNPKQIDFNLSTLLLLINNETFSNNEYYIDDSWLKYFITKYKFDKIVIDTLMSTAIKQEDFAAVKTLSGNYIFSKKELQETKEKKAYKDELNGKLDINEYYDPAYSKIDEIISFISHKLSQYIIEDQDGYTNLRKDKNTSSEILRKVKSGEHIEVLDNSGDWSLVKTKEGKKGYIHKSRIKK